MVLVFIPLAVFMITDDVKNPDIDVNIQSKTFFLDKERGS